MDKTICHLEHGSLIRALKFESWWSSQERLALGAGD